MLTEAFAAAQPQPADGQYIWVFGDETADATGRCTVHTYAAPGIYTATLLLVGDRWRCRRIAPLSLQDAWRPTMGPALAIGRIKGVEILRILPPLAELPVTQLPQVHRPILDGLAVALKVML